MELGTELQTELRTKSHETKRKNSWNIGAIFIMIAGMFWGTMSIFVRRMETYGLDSMQIVAVRFTVAALAFFLVFLLRERENFRKGLKDIPLFIATGFFSLLFFTWCYFKAIGMMEVSVAAILLYTSPIWVMLMSAVLFKETITKYKIIALLLAFFGCICISGLSGGNMTVAGVLFGIGSGIGYGLYSIFGTIALKKHSSFTFTTFSFFFAAVGGWILANPVELIACYQKGPTVEMIGWTIVMGLFSAFVPYMCYTLGLARLEPSKAAILATMEPMVATLVGIVIFKEMLTLMSGMGIVAILAAVVMLAKQ